MSNLIILLLSVLICFQFVTTIWNYKSFQDLKKRANFSNDQLNDAKYYELKYKHEFTIATISIVTTCIVILGYNSIQGIEDKLQKEYESKVKSTDSTLSLTNNKVTLISKGIDEKYSQIDTSMRNYQTQLGYFINQQVSFSNQSKKVNSELSLAQNKIKEINGKNILKQNIYVIENVPYDLNLNLVNKVDSNKGWEKIYFSQLKTIMGDKLPEFKKKPFIISSVSNEGSTATIRNVTTSSFEMAVFQVMLSENSPTPNIMSGIQYFNIMISEIPE